MYKYKTYRKLHTHCILSQKSEIDLKILEAVVSFLSSDPVTGDRASRLYFSWLLEFTGLVSFSF